MSSNRKSHKEKTGFSYYELFNSAGGNQSRSGVNKFLNDGSFLESFKKKQEQMLSSDDSATSSSQKCENPSTTTTSTTSKTDDLSVGSNLTTNSDGGSESAKTVDLNGDVPLKKLPTLPFIGKRRGGKVLPTGMVKKVKKEDEEEESGEVRTDAWSHYMAEVKRYQQQSCEDERKTRPLVK